VSCRGSLYDSEMLRISHNRSYSPAALYSPETLFFCSWYSFLLEAERTPGPSAAWRIRYIEKIHSPHRASNKMPGPRKWGKGLHFTGAWKSLMFPVSTFSPGRPLCQEDFHFCHQTLCRRPWPRCSACHRASPCQPPRAVTSPDGWPCSIACHGEMSPHNARPTPLSLAAKLKQRQPRDLMGTPRVCLPACDEEMFIFHGCWLHPTSAPAIRLPVTTPHGT
jgi:hypothetical protein